MVANRRPSTIRGTVVDETGSPVADAFVRLSTVAEGVVRSDDGGRFALPVFGDGPFWLVAATDWRRPSGSATGVAPGAADVTITIARGGSVRGTLVGFTQPSVTLRALGDTYPQIARVDGSSFALDELVAGDYIIGATSADGRSASTTTHVAAGATSTVTLTTSSVVHVDARVSTFGTGAPVLGARCFVVATAGDIVPPQFGDPNCRPRRISDAVGSCWTFDTAPDRRLPRWSARARRRPRGASSGGVAARRRRHHAGSRRADQRASRNHRRGLRSVAAQPAHQVGHPADCSRSCRHPGRRRCHRGRWGVGHRSRTGRRQHVDRRRAAPVPRSRSRLLRGNASFDVKLVVGPPG